ncbi:Pyruvate dehydrogenase [ubiquinone] [Pluralibacter gergoviae]|nr:Pyruvate dehydrogenase [ubiquinone] [Pluralibacter gergoviae]
MVHTTRAKEFIEPDNPYNVGMTGIIGNRAGMEAIDAADIMLCLGTDFAWTQFYPEGKRVVQIDRDPAHLGRRAPVALGLAGDVGDTIAALLPALTPRQDRGHLDKALKMWEEDKEGYAKSGEGRDPALIHPQTVTQMLDRLAAPDALFTADGGSPMVWLLRHLTANGQRRFLTSLLHGTMANAYPQAMGLAAAYPQRQTIALCGDGGMTMLMGDLLTLVQEKLPVKLLIFNNGSLGFVEMEQRVEGLLDAFTGLKKSRLRAAGVRLRAGELEGGERRRSGSGDDQLAGRRRPGAARREGEPGRAGDAAEDHGGRSRLDGAVRP